MPDSKRVRQLGDIRVTALEDGYGDAPIAVVVNIDEAGAAALAELSSGNDLLHPAARCEPPLRCRPVAGTRNPQADL